MKIFPDLIVCEHCDSVYRRRPLAPGEAARCARCAAPLYRASRLDVDRWLALTLAAAVAFVIANACPVVRVGFQGLHNEATLWEAAAVLAQGPIAVIAVPVALSIIVIPFVQIGLLAWVLLHARAGRRAPGFAPAMRALALLRPWSMVEVCMLGILVALIKLSHFLQIAPAAGLWATAGLMVLITLIANRSVHRLWELTETQPPAGAGA
jgi:paraquat-inducible protein A